MTRDFAHDLLNSAKEGAPMSAALITHALIATGDIKVAEHPIVKLTRLWIDGVETMEVNDAQRAW